MVVVRDHAHALYLINPTTLFLRMDKHTVKK